MLEAPIQKTAVKKPQPKNLVNNSVWWKENEKARELPIIISEDVLSGNKEEPKVADILPLDIIQSKPPQSPDDDPGFNNTTDQLKISKRNYKKHPNPASKARETQAAVKINGQLEVNSIAKAAQVVKMGEQKKKKFNSESFKQKLLNSIKMPKDEDAAKNYVKGNTLAEAKQNLNQAVAIEKNNAAGEIESTAQEIPDTSGVKAKQEIPLLNENPGQKILFNSNGMAAPKQKAESDISMNEEADSLDSKFFENDLTEEQLEKSNEPSFITSLSSKKSAQREARNAAADYRSVESPILNSAAKGSDNFLKSGLVGMFGVRSGVFKKVDTDRIKSKRNEEEIRTKVADDLQKIYDLTKGNVLSILDALDKKVNSFFDLKVKEAIALFTKKVQTRLDNYYGFFNRIARLIAGLPEEVNNIFTEEKNRFERTMSDVVDEVAVVVETELNRASGEISKGKTETEIYWKNQTTEVKKIAGDIYSNINDKYSELETMIEEKENSIIDGLKDKYNQALNSIEETFTKFKEEKKGFLDKAFDSANGVINSIKELKEMFFTVLNKVSFVVRSIISDPIGFLSNLISAIGQGLKNFGSNILKHLQKGFFEWLMGNMPAGIEFPDKWDLMGIFKFLMSVLGLTRANIRVRAVAKIGEPVVKALESAFDIFEAIQKDGIAGLWKYIKDKIDDLKSAVVDSIIEMLSSQIVKAGMKKLLSLLSPASAFVMACKLIYDLVMWFINNAKRILDLINGIIDSIANIAKGDVNGAANKVEDSLSRVIPITIGFLAGILGLGNLSKKVQDIIEKIRAPINKAIDWVIDKAIAVANKLGITKAIKKGKEFVDKKIEQGKEWAQEKAGKLLSFLGLKKTFKTASGETHTLFFGGEEENAELMVASRIRTYSAFIEQLPNEIKKHVNFEKAKNTAKEIDAAKKIRIKDPLPEKQEKNMLDKQSKIAELISRLADFTKDLFGSEIPDCIEPENKIESNSGFGKSMIREIQTRNKKGNGSSPSVTNEIFEKINKRRKDSGSYYVKGHLLNEKLGGTGKNLNNLTPLTREANSQHEKQVESEIKIAVDSGAVYSYEVNIEYGRGDQNPEDPKNFPAKATPEDKEVIKEIIKNEKHVPKSLKYKAQMLQKEKDEDKEWKKVIRTKEGEIEIKIDGERMIKK